MRRARIVAVATFVLVGATLPMAGTAAADRGDGREYTISNPPLAPLVVDGEATFVWQGELAGSGFIIEVPPAWNGELVMWAHGYRGEGTVLTVDAPGYGLREHLIELGYAWAASSYYVNGYVVDAGVRATHELAVKFRHTIGRPDRTYIAGVSMGGHITARAIEQHPNFYDGAMPLCGVVGDVELFDFFVDFTFVGQALADEDVFPITSTYQQVVVPRIQAALGTAGIGVGPPTNELGLQFRSIVVEQTGGPRPGADVAFSVWKDFLFSLAGPDDGGPLSLNPGRVGTNVGTDYEPDEPVAIDDEVRRVEPQDARARRSPRLGPIATIDGRIRVPVLTLHDLGDLFVPFSMEQYYAADVEAQGRSELLVQRAIRAIGHCEFSEAEITTAFDDLVAWVEDGIRPEGDDVTDAATVAAADYGCRFSQPDPAALGSRVLFARCP